MKTLTLIILFSLLASLCFANEVLDVLIKEKERAVFTLYCYNEKNQPSSISTGFFIDPSGLALTNLHVLKGAYKAKIKTSDGKMHDVDKLVDYNTSLDLAKILIKKNGNLNFPSIKLSNKTPGKGEKIFALTSDGGAEIKVSKGTVSAFNSVTNHGVYYEISGSLATTGGIPVFDMAGDVIAITVFGPAVKNNLATKLNYAVNVSNSKSLNKELNLKLEKASKEGLYDDFVDPYIQFLIDKDYEHAIEVCSKQIAEKPQAWLAYHYRGITKMEANRYTEAEQDIKRSIQLNKASDYTDYVALGKIYKHAKMYEQSKEAYMKALALSGKNALCYCELAKLAEDWLGQGNKTVEETYMKALSIDAGSCPFAYTSIAINLLSQQQFQKAIEYFSLAIQFETEKKGLLTNYFNRGNSYYETKQFQLAINDFEQCIKLMPGDYESCLSIGMCYLKMGKKTQACETFQRAKKMVVSDQPGTEAKSVVSKVIQMHCK